MVICELDLSCSLTAYQPLKYSYNSYVWWIIFWDNITVWSSLYYLYIALYLRVFFFVCPWQEPVYWSRWGARDLYNEEWGLRPPQWLRNSFLHQVLQVGLVLVEGRKSGWLLETCRSTVISSKEASPNRAVSNRALEPRGNNLEHHKPLDPQMALGSWLPHQETEGVAWGASFSEDHQICQERVLVKHASFPDTGDLPLTGDHCQEVASGSQPSRSGTAPTFGPRELIYPVEN